jgi:hypothetical protein
VSQKTGYEPAQGALMVTIPALGGLLAIPAVVGHTAYLPISAAMAVLAWRLWSPPVRRSFLVLAAGALITGRPWSTCCLTNPTRREWRGHSAGNGCASSLVDRRFQAEKDGAAVARSELR